MKDRKVLVCRCGDCTHWEILHHEADGQLVAKLHCVTCQEEFPVTINVPENDKLVWAPFSKAVAI